MYDWLSEALEADAIVVTANRRLARVLRHRFDQQQLIAGCIAWPTPLIESWHDWLKLSLRNVDRQRALPTIINAQQSQLLWERCLARELSESGSNLQGMVKLARDAWQRLADWQVTIKDVARSAQTDDQRLFASVAGRYLAILERENWVDDAGVAEVLLRAVREGQLQMPGQVTFAGFDRPPPVVASVQEAIRAGSGEVRHAPASENPPPVVLQSFDNTEAELRAAGAWAREQLRDGTQRSIAIISGDLEQQAERNARLVREGLVPGWQYGGETQRRAVNVSYGRSLSDYPAVAIALLLLRWLVRDLTSIEVSQLLRSPLIGGGDPGDRARLELRLRRLPSRQWTPRMVSGALRDNDDGERRGAWATMLDGLTKRRQEIPLRDRPANWARFIDETLQSAAWPGPGALDSLDFQLVNRWRDLLNDLARLELVSPSMNLETALNRLQLFAAETVFQPESDSEAVQLLGSLEPSGAQFDAIWISGLTAAKWPAATSPSPLLSRQLQRQKSMPDADPSDTLEYARTTLTRLLGAARTVVCSYPENDEDAEQTHTHLLDEFGIQRKDAAPDPGWHAGTLSASGKLVIVEDSVPPLQPEERVNGGANILQLQMSDPLAAFIAGRLGVRTLQPQASGIPAAIRGTITHDALQRLYAECPGRSTIAGWLDQDVDERIGKALAIAFSRHQRYADAVLRELLALEEQRLRGLLRAVAAEDVAREPFTIDGVEREIEFQEAGVRMTMRADRIDRLPDDSIVILDYKTGAKKTLLRGDGEPHTYQLVAYACAVTDPIAALLLVNIDSREVVVDGAGRDYKGADTWPDNLERWQQELRLACEQLRRGDVRVNQVQGITEARPRNLLSRYTELVRDA